MDVPELPQDLDGAIVAAVDDSPASREALRWAAGVAGALGRPLHVVTVWNFVTGQVPEDLAPDEAPTIGRWQGEAERRLAQIVSEELADQGAVHQLVLHGNTVPVLLAVSERAGHVVVGTRGRGGFAGLLLGSTSEQLVRHGHSPVTVIGHGSVAPGA